MCNVLSLLLHWMYFNHSTWVSPSNTHPHTHLSLYIYTSFLLLLIITYTAGTLNFISPYCLFKAGRQVINYPEGEAGSWRRWL